MVVFEPASQYIHTHTDIYTLCVYIYIISHKDTSICVCVRMNPFSSPFHPFGGCCTFRIEEWEDQRYPYSPQTSHHHPQPLRKQNLEANNCTTQRVPTCVSATCALSFQQPVQSWQMHSCKCAHFYCWCCHLYCPENRFSILMHHSASLVTDG